MNINIILVMVKLAREKYQESYMEYSNLTIYNGCWNRKNNYKGWIWKVATQLKDIPFVLAFLTSLRKK